VSEVGALSEIGSRFRRFDLVLDDDLDQNLDFDGNVSRLITSLQPIEDPLRLATVPPTSVSLVGATRSK